MAKRFQHKVCVVTGAAKGLGFAVCQELAARNAVVVMTDVDVRAVESSAAKIAAAVPSAKIESHGVDVANCESIDVCIQEIVARHGRIDYLFNNAGINTMAEFRDVTPEQWQRIVDVNLWGVIYGTQIAYRQMLKQGSGHIVNIASGLGLVPAPRNVPYATTKFAIYGLSESLRIEAKDLGIHVSVACPGWISTPMVEQGRAILGTDAVANGSGNGDHDSLVDGNGSIADAAQTIPLRFLTPEQSAQIILRGVLRKKARIVFPGYVRWFSRLYCVCAPLADLWFRHEIRTFRRRRDVATNGSEPSQP